MPLWLALSLLFCGLMSGVALTSIALWMLHRAEEAIADDDPTVTPSEETL